ncbi:MAG TPA: MGMT family protein [Planktothrix sp.]|jgi:methylated-DNA-protein-cysteine methyltransferase-like protein
MAKQKSPTIQQLNPFEQVYEIVKRIPKGKVLTYGAISKMMDGRLSAAAVGWAMNGLGQGKKYNSENVPWHRVINSKGGLSTRHESGEPGSDGQPLKLQQVLLEDEGVEFDDDHMLDVDFYLWKPKRVGAKLS